MSNRFCSVATRCSSSSSSSPIAQTAGSSQGAVPARVGCHKPRQFKRIVLGNMNISAMRSLRQGDPDGVNYHYPYPVAEGVRDYVSQNMVRTLDAGVEAAPAGGLKHPPFDALAGIDLPLAHRLEVEEAALGGVALLAHDDADADQLRLVGGVARRTARA